MIDTKYILPLSALISLGILLSSVYYIYNKPMNIVIRTLQEGIELTMAGKTREFTEIEKAKIEIAFETTARQAKSYKKCTDQMAAILEGVRRVQAKENWVFTSEDVELVSIYIKEACK